MITVTKRGPIYLDKNNNNTIVCNRPGIVIESVKDNGTNICIDPSIKNPYTISYASEGTLISFFSVYKKKIKKEIIDQAWFVDFKRAYFLSTLTQLDGYHSFRKENIEIGDIIFKKSKISEIHFQNLDSDYAYTFLLTKDGLLKLIYLWDIECQEYINPMSPLWKVPSFCISSKFVVKKDGICNDLNEKQMAKPLHDCFYPNCGVKLFVDNPILITIYSKQIVYAIRVLTWVDYSINKIKNSAPEKFTALWLALLKGEDTREFEKRFFTQREIIDFQKRLENGFKKFKEEIYTKAVLRNWVCFPDKLYNTIRLGDIIDSNLSIQDKQDSACAAIKGCIRGWRKQALFEFYKEYVE